MFSRLFHHSTTLSLVFLALLAGNLLIWKNSVVGAGLLTLFFLLFSEQIGRGIVPNEHRALQWWIGAWMLISGIMIAGTVCFYATGFPADAAYAMGLFAVPVALWIGEHGKAGRFFSRPHDLVDENRHRVKQGVWALASITVICLYALVRLLNQSATTTAIRTPWAIVAPIAFLIAGGLFLALFGFLYHGRERELGLVLVAAAVFVFLSVALFVYPLGYGFDPFIHQATERYLAQFGSISPKPFYYIGQYVFILFIHHVFHIPVGIVDRFALPTLTALFLPLAWYGAAAHLFTERKTAMATLAGIFLLPLATLIVTTPQGLADLWILLIILSSVPYLVRHEKPHAFLLFVPAVATACIHPIAGIPALLLLCLLASDPDWAGNKRKPLARMLFWTAAVLGSAALPISFLANGFLSGLPVQLSASALSPARLLSLVPVSIFFDNRYHPFVDFAYLFGRNAFLLILIASLIGWWAERKTAGRKLRLLFVFSAVLLVNFLLLSAFTFTFLIDYERQNYADRLIPLMRFALAPLLMLGLGALFSRLKRLPRPLSVFTITLLAACAVANLYVTYPRADAYETSHGFNTSQADFDAVQAIETMAERKPYVVLADQSVSAAGLTVIGFRYYGDQFAYPIPTGGNLYAYFLQMNDHPTRETALKALDEVQTDCLARGGCEQHNLNSVFFVVDSYWWQSARITEEAKQSADAWKQIDGGSATVFRYQRN